MLKPQYQSKQTAKVVNRKRSHNTLKKQIKINKT